MSKFEDVVRVLEESVSCSDGQSHYIDENHRRYLASKICQLFEQPDESRLLQPDELTCIWLDMKFVKHAEISLYTTQALQRIAKAQDAKTARIVAAQKDAEWEQKINC